MPFVKDDPNINRKGRGTGESLVNPKSLNGTEYREKEFKQILRRLKPLNNKAMTKLENLLDDEKTTENTKMRAIAFIIKEYELLMNEVYKPINSKDDDVDKDELNLAPLVSLKVLK